MKKTRTILFVDDVPMLREVAERFLAQSGRILTASGGEEAFVLAQRERPDLIFADLHMWGMNGAELCRAVKGHPDLRETPVIMTVTRGDAEERRAAVRAGADDLIRKPLSKTVLVEAVHRFLSYDVLRDLPRVNLSAPIRLMSDRRAGWGTVRNLSRRGMFIETDQSLTPQSLVNLHFTLPHQDADLLPVAQVRWTRAGNDHPAGIGVRFVELDGGTTLKLEDFVFERSLAEQAPLIGAPL